MKLELIDSSQQMLILNNFAKKLFSETTEVPPEFNKVFMENYWDLLA